MAQKINKVVFQVIKTAGAPLKNIKVLLNGSLDLGYTVRRKSDLHLFKLIIVSPLFWTMEKITEIPELPRNHIRVFILLVSELEECITHIQNIRKQAGGAEIMVWTFQNSNIRPSNIDSFSLFENKCKNFTVFQDQPTLDDLKSTASVLSGIGVTTNSPIIRSHQEYDSYFRVVSEPQIKKIYQWYKQHLQVLVTPLFPKQLAYKGMKRWYTALCTAKIPNARAISATRKDIFENIQSIVKRTNVRRYWYEVLHLFVEMKDEEGVDEIINALNLKSDFSETQLGALLKLCINHDFFPTGILRLVAKACSDQRLAPKSTLVQVYYGRHHFYHENLNEAVTYFEVISQKEKAPTSAQYFLARALNKKLMEMLPPDIKGKKKLSLVKKVSLVPAVVLEEMQDAAKEVGNQFSKYLEGVQKDKTSQDTQQNEMIEDTRKSLEHLHKLMYILSKSLKTKDESKKLSI